MEHHGVVDARPREQDELLVEGGEQLRLVVLGQHLPRMTVRGYHCRLHASAPGLSRHLTDEILMAAVHTIEETYRGHLWAAGDGLVVEEYLIHNLTIRLQSYKFMKILKVIVRHFYIFLGWFRKTYYLCEKY